ncbi:Integrating conjugative element protein [Pseudomonas syringae pv. maculicola]|uniref:Integrating conjugative element protein n=1 Tax=Pseudomonas syringae pv. maculicola TaxID=59511 RepID=A0A0N1JGX1_PSEYM|nr:MULTISPECIES: TIGR03749 family integrating conjugative element protein [Pseudomonas]KPB96772.1 Integrating conjugative element protein [Pseudomonas syringae pv. maculicola]MBM0212240.1 TIGR03749 family integrating conjugative element protein [Pseudomonas syringae pv. maculicola]RMM74672.1 Integrating conjugative element protein [Pseudomonas syringae pv. maculicola]RMV41143.1 Integrating conjugative element protein [Pseudomonas syringae pv. maculicola]WLG70272.1 TIGR03749 family integrating 
MTQISTLGLTIALMLWGVAAQAVELMRWERLPLAVPLVINQERVVFIDEDVRVGVPSTLTGKLRVQSTGGTLYLRASEVIAPTRLQLQSVATGEIILLDIAATPGEQPLEPVRILKNAQGQPTEAESSTVPVPERTPIPVALTRYAAQSLYAPLRTVESLPGVRRVPLKLRTELPTLLPTENVSSTPITSWRLGDYWVTAVKLRNRGSETVQLDPRRLQVKLFAAAFQHTVLGPVGSAEDTTVAYLVTRGTGLEQAVLLPPVARGADDES